jgi:hypothetical protein
MWPGPHTKFALKMGCVIVNLKPARNATLVGEIKQIAHNASQAFGTNRL